MIIIEYASNGEPVSDFNYEKWFQDVLKHKDSDIPITYVVSTSLPISVINLSIARGELKHSDIKFKYNGQLIDVNEYGVILDWPVGFADIQTDIITNLLKTAINKRKLERIKKKEINSVSIC